MADFDASRMWWELMRDIGECVDVGFAPIDDGATDLDWTMFSHVDYDGLGGIAKHLSERGIKVGELPKMRDKEEPGYCARFWLKYSNLFRRNKNLCRWKSFDSHWYPSEKEPTQPSGIAWTIFTHEETDALNDYAKRVRVSTNSLLLWALNSVVSDELMEGGDDRFWLMPVNMRGPIQRKNPYVNHSSYLPVRMPVGVAPVDVHEAIKTELKSQSHWRAWYAYTLLKASQREKARKRLQGYLRREGFPWCGAFTNVGNWPTMDAKALPEGATETRWIVRTLVLKSIPIGASVMSWRRALNLTVVTHPALTRDATQADEIMKLWRGKLDSLILKSH
ncbi:MAG: hypothetical protein VYA34_07990 [Myxococcota bacterium]|nr:hypothetical protein [Myxococcota bacterium]